MSRYNASNSYGFKCKKTQYGDYDISWIFNRYYSGSRLRFPQTRSRLTDLKGAKRFCKKHNIKFLDEWEENVNRKG
jgi:hypothetical protein